MSITIPRWTPSRRALLVSIMGSSAVSLFAGRLSTEPSSIARRAIPAGFPAQDPELVQTIVGRSHFDLDAVKDLIADQPELAKASWDWGFGDWESALGAASHTGRREIAEFLIAHGARPNLFTFAMLGKLDAVRAMIEAQPGVQRIPGPHGITLLAHAQAGGEAARDVLAYLGELGDADPRPNDEPLEESAREACLGEYVFAQAEDDETVAVPAVTVAAMRGGALGLSIGEGFPRGLLHQGGLSFHPAGAPSVRILFARTDSALCESVVIQMGTGEMRWTRR